jgi:hypothetical protein
LNLIWTNLRVPVEEDEKELPLLMARKLKVQQQSISGLHILRRSVDARKKPLLFFSYTLRFSLDLSYKEVSRLLQRTGDLKPEPVEEPRPLAKPGRKLRHRPIVVGAGPAGYFAALALAKKGYAPLVLERGDDVLTRTQKVEGFWRTGLLDEESNVQFGEGGAGTFSDGKLTTRIADSRITEVLETFVKHGAPQEILFLAKAHIGTDILKGVTRGLRQEIEALGGELAREINHRYGEKPKKPTEAEGDLALEMADILFIITCMANSLNIDLEDAFARMMEKYRVRDSNRWTRKSE